MFYMKRERFREVLETVWRPHRDAPSLLGDGWNGSTLSEACQDKRGKERTEKIYDRRRDRDLIRTAARDFAYYRGDK